MPESKISVLEKFLQTRGKSVVFVLNQGNADAKTGNAWDNLTDHGKLTARAYEFEGVDLYSALKGYLKQNKVPFSTHGELQDKYMIRVESEEGKKAVQTFVANVTNYREVEGRTYSVDDDTKRTQFRKLLEGLAKGQ